MGRLPDTIFKGGARRSRRVKVPLALLALASTTVALALIFTTVTEPGSRKTKHAGPAREGGNKSKSPYLIEHKLATGTTVDPDFKRPPRAGMLFNLKTGQVLWSRNPAQRLAIASLTKMMTAQLVVERSKPRDLVKISYRAVNYQGSGVGVLPKGRWVKLEPLLYGLLLPSGNDAAIALAEHTSGSVKRFVALMNRRGQELGLSCSRFTSPHGLQDRGNYSCAYDLAALARANLGQQRIRRITRRKKAVFSFPTETGELYLVNNNPLVLKDFPGATGLKTGYTKKAGRCLVATAKRGKRELGAVLLHSPDPYSQAKRLLNLGFRKDARVKHR